LIRSIVWGSAVTGATSIERGTAHDRAAAAERFEAGLVRKSQITLSSLGPNSRTSVTPRTCSDTCESTIVV
jgi:hypothetical protein